eukprot:TRINITY_DN4109_c0_g1_i2.p1 TRINITY_DN4109_c0_g1~~TRINITY_DN4109_c0_g1_i2.p1  ORF type:complete len:574 (+),score=94.25 TRINITY_DN4109_c0_g1_i2:345-2066(+)
MKFLPRLFSRSSAVVTTAGAADLPVLDSKSMGANAKPLSASDIEEALLEQFSLSDEYDLSAKEPTNANDTLKDEEPTTLGYSFMMTTDDKPIEHEYEFEFPEEVLHKIFAFLDFRTLCKACSVSKWWNTVANDPNLWRDLTNYHFYRYTPKAKEPNWKEEFKRKVKIVSWLEKSRVDLHTLRAPTNSDMSPVHAISFDDTSLLTGSSSEAFEWDFNEEMWIGRTCDHISEVKRVHMNNTFTYAVSNRTVRAWYQTDLYGLGKPVVMYPANFKFANFKSDYFAIFEPHNRVLIFKHNEKISNDNMAKAKAELRSRSADAARLPQQNQDDDEDSETEIESPRQDEFHQFEEVLNTYIPYGIGRADKVLTIEMREYLAEELIRTVFIQDKRDIVLVLTKQAKLFVFELSTGKLLRTVQCLDLKSQQFGQYRLRKKITDAKITPSGLLCIRHKTSKRNQEGQLISKERFISIYDTNRQMMMVNSDRSVYAFNDGRVDRIDIVGNFRSSFIAVASGSQLQVWQIYTDRLLLIDSFDIEGDNVTISSIKATKEVVAAGTSVGDVVLHTRRRAMTNCCIM